MWQLILLLIDRLRATDRITSKNPDLMAPAGHVDGSELVGGAGGMNLKIMYLCGGLQ